MYTSQKSDTQRLPQARNETMAELADVTNAPQQQPPPPRTTTVCEPMTMEQHAARPLAVDDTPSEPDAEQ